jgi:CDP-diacylglycerol pyrophosphatase
MHPANDIDYIRPAIWTAWKNARFPSSRHTQVLSERQAILETINNKNSKSIDTSSKHGFSQDQSFSAGHGGLSDQDG